MTALDEALKMNTTIKSKKAASINADSYIGTESISP